MYPRECSEDGLVTVDGFSLPFQSTLREEDVIPGFMSDMCRFVRPIAVAFVTLCERRHTSFGHVRPASTGLFSRLETRTKESTVRASDMDYVSTDMIQRSTSDVLRSRQVLICRN